MHSWLAAKCDDAETRVISNGCLAGGQTNGLSFQDCVVFEGLAIFNNVANLAWPREQGE
jgi:hypothetical protein